MHPSIAVITASGRAFYLLVSELRRRREPFIVLKPDEPIPLNIEVAITTELEKNSVLCPNIITYDGKTNPSVAIDDALQVVRGKYRYDNLVLGIDPGKEFGVAVIGDGVVLETKDKLSEEGTAKEAVKIMNRFKGSKKVVKIGNGANNYRRKLITILDEKLPPEVDIESVEESGTTKNINMIFSRRISKDTFSAIKISMRKGRKLARRRSNMVSSSGS